MDFKRVDIRYSPEVEEFRQEVRQWLDDNVPGHMKSPIDEEEDNPAELGWAREIYEKLGDKGWLFAAYPKEYGGGGLTREHAAVIHEEMVRRNAPIMWTGATTLVLVGLMVWATEEQKQKYLPGILKGRTVCVETFTEPHGGSDLANVKSRAVRDGEDWILNGQKIFITAPPNTGDLLYGPFLTDPDSPRHRNLGFFLIDRNTPGVSVRQLRLLNGVNQNFVTYDDVRVHADQLIGGDHQGWQVVQSVLEAEHGGAPTSIRTFGETLADSFLDFIRQASPGLSEDPTVLERVADLYTETRISSLFGIRNVSMYRASGELSYEGSQSSCWGKESNVRRATWIADVLGPYALLHHQDPRATKDGWAERQQRGSITGIHPGGTYDVQKVIIARRLGMSRTQERPAPTAVGAR